MTTDLLRSPLAAELRARLRPGMTVALGDGVGALRCADDGTSVAATLSALAAELGDIRLVLGWLTAPLDGLATEVFRDIVALMPGWGVRDVLRAPNARFVPVRLSAIAALLRDALCPDVLLTRVIHRDGSFHFGTEVSWQRELVDSGVPVLAVVDDGVCADAGPPLPASAMRVVGRSADRPVTIPSRAPEPVHEALADAVLRFVPEGARLQYGPGQLGTALLDRIRQPVSIDTGLLTDAVLGLERKGLLAGTPSATYLFGSEALYTWADGRPILRGIEHTHDLTRLSRGTPLVAVNTAIEIDPFGQVNVEGVGDKVVGGIGGHPDYCAAGAMSRGGLSIIAVPSTVNGRSPYVERLSRPASTPAHDIDVIVTESGHADLRGADWTQRRRLIAALFE
ncbi:acetyl-CoA hydrolase/transferase C-terminal domain-containing protein [Mycolicibacterium thermoresistibile]|uniref:Acetyl-CoA hydrolase/transferase n=2 Tax=Mycolicibacterium thermoresistibile TaxID=1797 RepID=A0A124E936_MYCTH|nr:putative acetyl-CoA hydrolase/transferase [Mycolicibacterium thermoresistibile ATCC 19527]MCV7186722.1 acetyl-CoA hydrolase [Mycolicibacterium thermoresistibile]GAT17666.1 acetyl-CoA hydrolase/transferase [Mycolicibacterium thermoresistibile]SNW19381.1 putative acetyl-CoA hydrolase/transferase [Mycolicibacterium thermoresistibile]